MKYLLNWNDKYLDVQIVSGPLADDAAAKQVMKKQSSSAWYSLVWLMIPKMQ